jgi:peptidoglycan/LPS O-acetylase OafA/YrhL
MTSPGRQRSYFLDLSRMLAALNVLVGHALCLVFVPWRDISAYGWGWKGLYILLSLGSPAVIVFFVLSGYLICGEYLSAAARGTWSFRNYAVKRLSRLYIVLLPALAMTAILDYVGKNVLLGKIYTGELSKSFMITPNDMHVYDFSTLLQNLLFLQTVTAPPFGTNGVLWSLANEFWYYVIFGLVMFSVCKRKERVAPIATFLLAVLICALLPGWLVLDGLVWLIGAGTAWITTRLTVPSVGKRTKIVLVALFVTMALAGVAFPRSHIPDFTIGLSFAFLILAFVRPGTAKMPFRRLVEFGADMSYSLYLFHFPFLCIAAVLVLHEQQRTPQLSGVLIIVGLMAAAILYSAFMYFLFERRTKAIQAALLSYRVPVVLPETP